ncbi:hypothetical protein LQ759_17045 [Serratia marcescens]|uniref:hypothetical protein n=1 Tax=Serratia marcescens TaxID=615 RepID=UPI001F264D6C|nr:hypothetical protein [Serratia marcescens]MCF1611597.1 hypothetical protein [Serratia marcescens]
MSKARTRELGRPLCGAIGKPKNKLTKEIKNIFSTQPTERLSSKSKISHRSGTHFRTVLFTYFSPSILFDHQFTDAPPEINIMQTQTMALPLQLIRYQEIIYLYNNSKSFIKSLNKQTGCKYYYQ